MFKTFIESLRDSNNHDVLDVILEAYTTIFESRDIVLKSVCRTKNKPAFESIEAYHGSGKQFDTFLTSKIGSGEGIEKFGHGLYFTESPQVAKYYADQYNQKEQVIYKVRIQDGNYMEWDAPMDNPHTILKQAQMEDWEQDNIDDLMDSFGLSEMYPDQPVDAGSIYELISQILGSTKEASEFFLRAGIDGVKFQSGTLSGIDDSEFNNYVVFDESMVKIEEKQ